MAEESAKPVEEPGRLHPWRVSARSTPTGSARSTPTGSARSTPPVARSSTQHHLSDRVAPGEQLAVSGAARRLPRRSFDRFVRPQRTIGRNPERLCGIEASIRRSVRPGRRRWFWACRWPFATTMPLAGRCRWFWAWPLGPSRRRGRWPGLPRALGDAAGPGRRRWPPRDVVSLRPIAESRPRSPSCGRPGR